MKYFVVVGKEKDTGDNPLAATLWQIGRAKEKDIRVFVTSSTGTCEFGSEAEKKLTKDVVSETFASVDKSNYRLLLFDAESISDALIPAAGLVAWLTAFRTSPDNNIIKSLDFFEVVSSFFIQESTGIFWTGLKFPDDFDPEALLQSHWKTQMDGLMHGEQHVRQS